MIAKKMDYSKLDAAIVAAISSGRSQFYEFAYSGAVETASKALEVEFGNPGIKPSWRFVDSRLQALRKKGAIRFAGQQAGWALVDGGKGGEAS